MTAATDASVDLILERRGHMRRLRRAESELDFAIEAKDAARSFGFTWFTYLRLHKGKFEAICTYPMARSDHYRREGYADSDRAVVMGPDCMESFAWMVKSLNDVRGSRSHRLAEDAESFGIASGLTISLACCGDARWMAVFASNNASLPIDLHAERVRHPARLWAEELHSLASDRIKRFSASERQAALTPRQTECLAAAADGYSAKQIAPMLGLTIRTVEMHWCEAKKQLVRGPRRARSPRRSGLA